MSNGKNGSPFGQKNCWAALRVQIKIEQPLRLAHAYNEVMILRHHEAAKGNRRRRLLGLGRGKVASAPAFAANAIT
jgi:hypothetical protein